MITTTTAAATAPTTKAMSGKDLHAPLIENFKWKLYQCFKKRNFSYSSIKRFETIYIPFVTIYNLAHLGPIFLSYRNQSINLNSKGDNRLQCDRNTSISNNVTYLYV